MYVYVNVCMGMYECSCLLMYVCMYVQVCTSIYVQVRYKYVWMAEWTDGRKDWWIGAKTPHNLIFWFCPDSVKASIPSQFTSTYSIRRRKSCEDWKKTPTTLGWCLTDTTTTVKKKHVNGRVYCGSIWRTGKNHRLSRYFKPARLWESRSIPYLGTEHVSIHTD